MAELVPLRYCLGLSSNSHRTKTPRYLLGSERNFPEIISSAKAMKVPKVLLSDWPGSVSTTPGLNLHQWEIDIPVQSE